MLKVLIVDDEPNIVMSLEFLIKKSGFEVLIARDGSEALASIETEKPDIVILDIMMPFVDGYEVCEYIKKTKKLNSKIIFLSAKDKEADIQKGFDAGADAYITKPFSTKNLVKKVKELAIELTN